MPTRKQRARRADERGNYKKAADLRASQEYVDKHPVDCTCEKCCSDCVGALCGSCKPKTKVYPKSSDAPQQLAMKRGGRRTRRRKRKRKTKRKKRKTKKRRRKRKRKTKRKRRRRTRRR